MRLSSGKFTIVGLRSACYGTTLLLCSLLLVTSPLSVAAKESAGKYRSMGEVALSERRYNDALSYYNKAIEMEPDNAKNYNAMFKVHKRMRKIELALEDLNKALELADEADPKRSEYLRERSKLYVSLGRCARALDDIDYVIRRGSPNERDIKTHNDLEVCAVSIESATVSFTKNDWNEVRRHLDIAIPFTEKAVDLLYMRAKAVSIEIGLLLL